MAEEKGLTVINEAKRKFELACKDASALQIVNNFGAAFTAVNVIALLRKLGVKYFIDVSFDKGQTAGFAEVPCKINYTYNGEKNSFGIVATVKKDDYSSPDQIRGKAERRAKKALYEYITGCDFGDADEQSGPVEDVEYKDVTHEVEAEVKNNANAGGTLDFGQAETNGTQQPPKTPGF